jgi:hypothetical protein
VTIYSVCGLDVNWELHIQPFEIVTIDIRTYGDKHLFVMFKTIHHVYSVEHKDFETMFKTFQNLNLNGKYKGLVFNNNQYTINDARLIYNDFLALGFETVERKKLVWMP